MARDWTHSEIDLIVADYFSILAAELASQPINKAERNRALQQMLPRSRGSIEFKHQNISAVLLGLGQPWINGYKPAANFQNALVDGVLRWLDSNPDWLRPLQGSPTSHPIDILPLQMGPPPSQRNEPPLIDSKFIEEIGRRCDVAERDGRNRALGKAGEELVLAHECQSLRQSGREDLADRVRWTSVQDGDGFGFDIASFERDGREKLIEVKTTNGWERTPFYISQNELAVAEARHEEWQLIRVWNFARKPNAFALRHPIAAQLDLRPASYIASLR